MPSNRTIPAHPSLLPADDETSTTATTSTDGPHLVLLHGEGSGGAEHRAEPLRAVRTA